MITTRAFVRLFDHTSSLLANISKIVCFARVTLAGLSVLQAWGLEAAPRPTLILTNSSARLEQDLKGGGIGVFMLADSTVNPLNWGVPQPGDERVRGFGHFLCLDRWGPPSDSEGANGMPYHGEAASVVWNPGIPPNTADSRLNKILKAELPIAGLHIERSLSMHPKSALVTVRETVTNKNKLGRVFNWVQHPTIAPPFLNEFTLVDCNGRQGFAQGNPMPFPEQPSFFWPQALNSSGESVNLRKLGSDPNPNVVSYAIDDDYGWVTAATGSQQLLIGYLWRTRDYPWVSLWRDTRDGKPTARGLEFGSTGLHQPFPILIQKGSIFGRPLVAYLDAGATMTKSFAMFLVKIPTDYQGVERVQLESDKLVIQERGRGKERNLTIYGNPDL